MADKKVIKEVRTPLFRISYPKIWNPDVKDDGKKVWGCTAIFAPDADLTALKQLVKETRDRKWPKGGGSFRRTFRPGVTNVEGEPGYQPDGFDLENNPEYAGNTIVSMKSYGRQPGVAYFEPGNPKPVEMENPEDLYAGCYCIAKVNAFAYENQGNRGVSIGLCSLLKIKDGEPLVARHNAVSDFESVNASDYGVELNADEFAYAGDDL